MSNEEKLGQYHGQQHEAAGSCAGCNGTGQVDIYKNGEYVGSRKCGMCNGTGQA